MKKIFVHMIVSLDGYINGPDGEMNLHFVDDEFEDYINNLLKSIDGMIYGRKSFELLSQYWPTAAENPDAAADPSNPEKHIEAAHMMNELPKYVVSKTIKKAEWNNSHIISENLYGEISKLKNETGKDIALFAGGETASNFIRLNLIDELRIVLNPVVFGGGSPLFRGGYDRINLKLLKTKKFQSGAIVLYYKPVK